MLTMAMLTSAVTVTASGALAADRPTKDTSNLKVGRTVTLVLTDGTRVKGRITDISVDAITIVAKNETERTVDRDDIAAIHTGMPKWGKVLIGVGVAYGVLWLLFLASGGIGPVCC
jgi:hypothetical protein